LTKAEELKAKKCVPCEGNVEPLPGSVAKIYLEDLPGWTLSAGATSINKLFVMKDFPAAVRLIQAIASVAEAEDHHPDIHLTGYRKLTIEISTHSIGGLSENDFILAVKIDALPKTLK